MDEKHNDNSSSSTDSNLASPLSEQLVEEKEEGLVAGKGIKIQFIFYTCNNPAKFGANEPEVRTKWIREWAKKTTFHTFCYEQGEQGTPHYQGCAMWKTETKTSVVQRWLESMGWTCDFRPCRNIVASIEYCEHSGAHAGKAGLLEGPFNTGVKPSLSELQALSSKNTTDKQWLVACLGTTSYRDLMLDFPKQWLKYGNKGVAEIRQNERKKSETTPYPFRLPNGAMVVDPTPDEGVEDEPAKQRHVYIYGPANSRKSAWLKQTFAGKSVFFVRKSKYPFEGYNNEPVIIADMVLGIQFAWLEELCEYDEFDRCVPGDTRYTSYWMHRKVARMVIILSNDAPKYPGREGPFNERFWVWKLAEPIDLPPKRYRAKPQWGDTNEYASMPETEPYQPKPYRRDESRKPRGIDMSPPRE